MDTTIEDLQDAFAAGRGIREYGPYHVRVGREGLDFRKVVLPHPVVTGKGILEAAEALPTEEHLLFKITQSGVTEELRPDAAMDLRSDGVERFVVFRSDRAFRFLLDERAFDWGASRISGATLKHLAGVDISSHDVWQDARGGTDVLIEDDGFGDLAAPSVERFITRPIGFFIVVNGKRKEVFRRRLSYWEIVKLAFPEAVPSENIIYTINYARGPHANPEGAMVEGQHVKIKDNMVFYVTPTDRS
ncbi:multiubiquitin domain-containing protein [Paraburkholderia sediminicola]|uniref:multiubiquitin domain-containing protein n=1 Tax=Paraburkholderia sediminicola TaxID=458836 RepID=UPI0038BBB27B